MRSTLFSLFTTIFIFFFFHSCGTSDIDLDKLPVQGGRKYGGEFRFMSLEKPTSLFPTYAADIYSSRIITQIFEPLVSYDMNKMTVVPVIAESFSVSSDARVYTFQIRKGIQFHEDDCFRGETRELRASDVKFTLDLACSGLKKNQIHYLLTNRIVGGEEFSEKSANSMPEEGVSGIKVLDDYTLEIQLKDPVQHFEMILSHPNLGIVSKIAFETYGEDADLHPIGSGPFMLKSDTESKIVLNRHPNYWKKDEFGNQLPFLENVVMTYAKDKKSELMAFRKSEIDIVLEIPVEEIQNILGSLKEAQAGKNVKHKIDSERSMNVTYIATACESDEFKDVRVRQAFNLAIDREDIVYNTLDGEGTPAIKGFVPDMPRYNNSQLNGAKFDPVRAKSLLKEAGFPNGAGFPILDFYVNAKEGSRDHKMARTVANQLKENLNIQLNVRLCSMEEREKAIAEGNAKIWRAGWVADYPNPQSFLDLFYGGRANEHFSTVNSFKFHNEDFDQLFEKASSEKDMKRRNKLLSKCDQLVVDQAPVFPIFNDDHIVMINTRIRNFKANSMEILYLADVFMKEPQRL